jgi:uncharacterized protein RhaS with RHS repeats
LKHTLIIAAFAVAMAATPSKAQPVAADLLPAYEVSTIVASMGLRPVGRPAWRRGRYVIAAVDGYGREVNVVLDARDGQVLAVRPLGRGRFGPPPPGYGRPAPYDPMDGQALPPGGPFPDDDEFFDNDRQQGSLSPRAPSRDVAPMREPSVTGNVARRTPPVRRDAAPNDATPVPRPRPALARANDPGTKPAASVTQPASATPADAKPADAKPADVKPAAAQKPGQAEAKAEVSPDALKRDAGKAESAKTENSKSEAAKPAVKQTRAAPAVATKPEAAKKPQAAEREIRVIDLSKPKDAAKPADKPGEAIRF